ncbi:hypothetical protein RDV89_07430 [Nocardioides zeae]|uniref:WXG100 family type VII secretion target n=1 Tax=Nocardioides imazamoxiresistens TaxID=3231893 RepID=A0ABU3PUM6_9ACTN|nr:hypothetical protein [Nocardioides zeae]MDT9592894.1 hypothetical protein [Nocardioides zeae]
MSFHGMDTEQVAALGSQMTSLAARLREIEARYTQRLDAAPWVGADRERFVGQWNGGYAVALRTAAEALEAAGDVAAANVREQERISS